MYSVEDPTLAAFLSHAFLAHTKEAVFVINEQGIVLAHSPGCQSILGTAFHTNIECFKQFPALLDHDRLNQDRVDPASSSPQKTAFKKTIHPATTDTQIDTPISITGYPISDTHPHWVIWLHPIQNEAQSPADANAPPETDHLTQLPTRFHLTQYLDQLTQQRRENTLIKDTPPETFALLLLDFDRFKLINDTLGHQRGDLAIHSLAQRLQGYLQNEFVNAPFYLARLGGDEFAVLLFGNPSKQLIQRYAEGIMECLSKPFTPDGAATEIFMTTSIGSSCFPADGDDSQSLLRHAEFALYQAKSMGGFTYQPYIAHTHPPAMERLQLESDLRYALERREFRLEYQPQVEVSSGKITGFEALIRWHHPTRGTISPGIFIPIIEETGLIDSVGHWVLTEACRQLSYLKQKHKRSFKMAINFAARQFNQTTLSDTIASLLAEFKLQPHELEIEMTESLLMCNKEETLSTVQALAIIGVKLSIDDFGTGYSSLAYLKRFPINTLKINQSFIRDLVADQDDATLVKAIITMANSLNITTIAEGVETIQQYHFLMDHQCDIAQGYLISQSLTPSDLDDWITKDSYYCFKQQKQAKDITIQSKIEDSNAIESVY